MNDQEDFYLGMRKKINSPEGVADFFIDNPKFTQCSGLHKEVLVKYGRKSVAKRGGLLFPKPLRSYI